MALVRNPLAMKMRGRAGAYSFYTENGRQIVRVAQNSSNFGPTASRTTAQQIRRVKWPNLVNFYKAAKNFLRGGFEYKKSGQSDYNMFMSLNMSEARVGLRKDMALHGECVVDLFRITDGSLGTFSMGFIGETNNFLTSIICPDTGDATKLTIGALSTILLGANGWMHEGTQLSIIQAWDTETAEHRVYAKTSARELILDTNDTRLVNSVLGCYVGHNEGTNTLMCMGLDKTRCTAVVVSDSTTGSLKVSAERLWPGSIAEATAMSAPAWIDTCIVSYGVDESRFLDSGYQYEQ